MTDEELIEKFQIPNTWARPALLFAVRTGLLAGKGTSGLCPTDHATRAEFATMAVRIAGTQAEADLSSYTDVGQNAWFRVPLAKAKALGIIKGLSNTVMAPNAVITRQEVASILARLFGVRTTDKTAIYDFSDWRDVSNWAALDMSAMIQAGYIRGNHGKLNPKAPISRQEIAQMICNILTDFNTELPESFDGSFALAGDAVAPGTVVSGDLLICGETDELTLENVTVNGRLIIQGIGSVRLQMTNCTVGALVLCRSTVLTADGTIPKLVCTAPNAELHADIQTLELWDASVILAEDAGAQTVEMMTDGCQLEVRCAVGTVNVHGNGQTITGSGSIEKLNVYGSGLTVSCTVGARTDIPDLGITQVVVTKQEDTSATVAKPTGVASVEITNLPAEQKEYTVSWYVDGKCQYSEKQVLLKEGDVVAANLDFSEYMSPSAARYSVVILFTLQCGSEKRSFTYTADVSDALAQAAKAIRTQNIQAKVLRNCTLYSTGSLSTSIGSVKAGTWVTYILYDNKNGYYYSAKIRLPNGTVGWVKHSNLQVSSGNFYVTWDYSTAVKEYWVNDVRKASSSTNYLVWTSLYTQKVNIFTRSNGKWKLVKTFPCSSGLNTSNTPPEDKTIQRKTMRWNFSDDGNYYVDHVTVLDSRGRAFHSRPKYYSGAVKDATMGRPSSHGCIRMMDDGVQYIYSNCPVGTKVILY
ncbi:MAG: S-layer homology domain-containing protein [Oscillospiraceae bacterium]|nr:S-layer homology domain-containing protein [Oscillospiraceae bacterium]